ncbi:hypothetical protein HanRHA438_Chr03g0142681 [Helianthus annuus]|nr:hypothetical protein HanHA300_Chr03g0109281 [Helianthus annuus]KAJ0937483.1 hypothetical protein HanRHA438_Chr03g0142681 [Helianthus annuus]
MRERSARERGGRPPPPWQRKGRQAANPPMATQISAIDGWGAGIPHQIRFPVEFRRQSGGDTVVRGGFDD